MSNTNVPVDSLDPSQVASYGMTDTASRGLALVVGAQGGLGQALAKALSAAHTAQSLAGSFEIAEVLSLGRSSLPALDYADEASVAGAAKWVAGYCADRGLTLRFVVVATGFLHGEVGQPERSWAHLDAGYLKQVFLVNAIGPALVMKHFLPLLPREGRCLAAFISAKVGSIEDNALGGWYGYRASKAALNQLVKTASIELTRRNRQAICVAVHPGTVSTPLSQPFAKTGLNVRPAPVAAAEILSVLDQLQASQTGTLVDYKGQQLPW